MTLIERLKSLVKSFPEKDRELAYLLIESRKFEELWELVCSSMYLVRKNKATDADLADMSVFKSELSSYMYQSGLGDDEEFEDEEEVIDTYEEY